MTRRPTNSDGAKVERRKAARYPVSVPIEASWRGPDGKTIKEDAIAKQVNANGGFLQMETYPEIGTRVMLANFLSAEMVEARVIATPNSRMGVSQGVIVELVVPSERFWGADLQAKKASVELQKLEKALQSEGVDARLLKEFREAVECVRTAASVAQLVRERQLQGREDAEMVSIMAADRIRRGTNLCAELAGDLESGRIRSGTPGVDELRDSLEEVHAHLRRLTTNQK